MGKVSECQNVSEGVVKIRVILEVEVVHGESFRGIFTVFLKTKSEHWAVETFKGVSEEESKFAFCFCS